MFCVFLVGIVVLGVLCVLMLLLFCIVVVAVALDVIVGGIVIRFIVLSLL